MQIIASVFCECSLFESLLLGSSGLIYNETLDCGSFALGRSPLGTNFLIYKARKCSKILHYQKANPICSVEWA